MYKSAYTELAVDLLQHYHVPSTSRLLICTHTMLPLMRKTRWRPHLRYITHVPGRALGYITMPERSRSWTVLPIVLEVMQAKLQPNASVGTSEVAF